MTGSSNLLCSGLQETMREPRVNLKILSVSEFFRSSRAAFRLILILWQVAKVLPFGKAKHRPCVQCNSPNSIWTFRAWFKNTLHSPDFRKSTNWCWRALYTMISCSNCQRSMKRRSSTVILNCPISPFAEFPRKAHPFTHSQRPLLTLAFQFVLIMKVPFNLRGSVFTIWNFGSTTAN